MTDKPKLRDQIAEILMLIAINWVASPQWRKNYDESIEKYTSETASLQRNEE